MRATTQIGYISPQIRKGLSGGASLSASACSILLDRALPQIFYLHCGPRYRSTTAVASISTRAPLFAAGTAASVGAF